VWEGAFLKHQRRKTKRFTETLRYLFVFCETKQKTTPDTRASIVRGVTAAFRSDKLEQENRNSI